jgi:hypothetical protein
MKSTEAAIPNGGAGAAILAASVGCFALGILAVAADGSKAAARLLTFYRPTGPLSGVTTTTILIWVAVWVAGNRIWRGRTIAIAKVIALSFAFLVLGLLLTFPPCEDFLLRR